MHSSTKSSPKLMMTTMMMTSKYFSLEQSTDFSDFPTKPSPGSIHIIGVCGVAMGALAIALSDQGYRVSGSDQEFYPPMSGLLERSGVNVFRGYSAEHISEGLSLVVIGNSVPRTNEEVQAVEALQIPHTFFAKLAGEILLQGKRSVVISGTHGKTTTTALISYGLKQLNRDPSYFVGGEVSQLETSLRIGKGDVGVIEGDEYDSVFYVKRPKFLFYPPEILVVNAIEFDHADIYPDLAAIEEEFRQLLARVPATGRVIACTDYLPVRRLLSAVSPIQVTTFGRTEEAQYRLSFDRSEGDFQHFRVTCRGGEGGFSFATQLLGEMNGLNVLASFLVAEQLGISREEWEGVAKEFTGAVRRFQRLYESDSLLVFEDFAHHPTAVQEAIAGLRQRYPDAEHWIAFEPRSNTSRRAIFQEEYSASFRGADRLFLREVTTRRSDAGQALLDLHQLQQEVAEHGTECLVFPNGEEIGAHLRSQLKAREDSAPKVVLTVMSNGSFDGLPNLLVNPNVA
ncbi:Mur ligase family protein [bacterium]|nr:Mur ligase family protein [bacterium]